jgi:hypothetical protein
MKPRSNCIASCLSRGSNACSDLDAFVLQAIPGVRDPKRTFAFQNRGVAPLSSQTGDAVRGGARGLMDKHGSGHRAQRSHAAMHGSGAETSMR